MAHVQFTDVQDRPMEFLDLTSLTLDEFQQLIPPFEARSRRLWRRGASMGSPGLPAVSACALIGFRGLMLHHGPRSALPIEGG